jgi:hypothetical protein
MMDFRGQILEAAEAEGDGAPSPSAAAEPAVTFQSDDSGRVRNYDELEGNEGRSVFFRPHRYGATDLEPLRATVTVEHDGQRHQCPLRDVSQNGVAFVWTGETPPRTAERVRIAMRFDAHEAFRGEATVGSVRTQDGGTIVGVLFHDFLLDVDEVLQLREIRTWDAEGRGSRLAEKAWNLAGQERFKSLVAEMRLYLEDAQREFNALEERLPWHVLNGTPSPARTALISRVRNEFVSELVRQGEAVDAALRQVPGGLANPAAREWSLRHLDQFWMTAPICRWTKNKPFGYPGDYEVMNHIYERRFEGATLFAKAVGLVFLSTRTAHAVRCRKDLIKRQIQALLQQHAGSKEPVRVLSIAAGPAHELFELFSSMDELPVPLEVVLFEQDKNALAHAWRRLRPNAESRFPHRIRLTYLHDSVKRLLRDATLFQGFGRFDLVYSAGLLDYFQRSTGVVLSRRLAAAVKPGGRLLMANMVDHATRWLMEWHLDWNLIYRTREELLEIGHRAVPQAQIRILEEETGINPFFELTPR